MTHMSPAKNSATACSVLMPMTSCRVPGALLKVINQDRAVLAKKLNAKDAVASPAKRFRAVTAGNVKMFPAAKSQRHLRACHKPAINSPNGNMLPTIANALWGRYVI